MIDTLRVLQWNAARSLAAIHSLTPLIANNPQPPHLLLIQEPPWYQIGTQPSLTDAAGTLIFNVPSIAGYTPCLPPTTPPRVVADTSLDLLPLPSAFGRALAPTAECRRTEAFLHPQATNQPTFQPAPRRQQQQLP